MNKQLAHIWEYAQSVAASEDYLPDLTTIDKEKVKQTVDNSTRYSVRKKMQKRK